MGPYFIVELRLIHVNVRIIAMIIHVYNGKIGDNRVTMVDLRSERRSLN